jgi:hypothetical protein
MEFQSEIILFISRRYRLRRLLLALSPAIGVVQA